MVTSATVVKDSISPEGSRLVTLEIVMPRVVLAELTRHRVASFSVESSRAVSSKRKIQQVRESPVIPPYWGKEQRGMNPGDELEEWHLEFARGEWEMAARGAAMSAEMLLSYGVHHSIVNRILEPFMWIRLYMTSVDWDNLLNQRDHKAADPMMQEVARCIREALDNSTPTLVYYGEWHAPLITQEEANAGRSNSLMIAAARIARVSYDTRRATTAEEDLELAQRLIQDNHWSPFEAICTPRNRVGGEPKGNLPGWIQLRRLYDGYQLKPYGVSI